MTTAPGAPYDVVCLNAYPKDGELLQVGNALNCYRTSRQPLLKSDGTLVITACCQLGGGTTRFMAPACGSTGHQRSTLSGRS